MTVPSFGPYEVLEQVASGSTGTVYRARHLELDRIVAIKELNAAMCGFPGLLDRFRSEAQMLAELDNEHIVAVYDYVEEAGRAWIVEEWVVGAALDEVMSAYGQLTPQQAVGSLRGALLGLAYAHERGLIHRDIAPNNIVADEAGTSKLLDFGLAAPVGTVGVCGTPAYVSPEAATGTAMGKPSDVYSAGAVLYTLLTGAPPYPAANPAQAMRMHMDEPVPSLRGHGRELAGVVRHAMAKDASQRPPDAAALLAELEDAAEKRFGAGWLAGASIAGAVAATVAARPGRGAQAAQPSGAAQTVVVTAAAADTGKKPAAAETTRVAAKSSPVAPPPPPPAPPAPPRKARKFNGRNVAIAGATAVVVAGAAIGVAVASGGGGDEKPTPPLATSPAPTTTSPSASPSSSPTVVPLVLDGPDGDYAYVVKVVESSNTFQPAGTVLNGIWTFASKCAEEKCTGRIVSSGGATYTYTYDGEKLVAKGSRDSACLDYNTGQPIPGSEGSYHEDIVTKLHVAKRAKAKDGHLGVPLVLEGTQSQVQRSVKQFANCGTDTTRQERTVKATLAK